MIRQALAIGADGHSNNAGMEHITIEDLKSEGHIPLAFHPIPTKHPFLPYTSGPLPTPSGKIEFYSETLAAPVSIRFRLCPSHRVALGRRREALSARVAGRKADNYMNSTFANLPGHRKMEARPASARDPPADAQPRGVATATRCASSTTADRWS
jgi:anaerobic selenocysteine-containing dehydrogenase